MTRCLAVIPARAGSKGLPRKNLCELHGRPLVVHSIEHALACALIDGVVVSTEDPEIAAVAVRAGATVHERDPALATDHSAIEDVVRAALLARGGAGEWDRISLLQPTSPLRDPSRLTEAIVLADRTGAGAVFGVVPAAHHPYKMLVSDAEHGALRPVSQTAALSAPRQTLPVAYRQSGSLYVVDSARFLAENSLFIEPVLPLLVSEREAIDIDSQADLDACRQLLAAESSNRSA